MLQCSTTPTWSECTASDALPKVTTRWWLPPSQVLPKVQAEQDSPSSFGPRYAGRIHATFQQPEKTFSRNFNVPVVCEVLLVHCERKRGPAVLPEPLRRRKHGLAVQLEVIHPNRLRRESSSESRSNLRWQIVECLKVQAAADLNVICRTGTGNLRRATAERLRQRRCGRSASTCW